MIHIYEGALLSHKKEWNNAISDNMDGPREKHTKWNKSDEDKYHTLSLLCGIQKWYKGIYLQNKNRLTDLESKFMVTKRERLGER